MDRLSIYELLSFLVPGSLVIELVNYFSVELLNSKTIFTVQNLGEGMVFLFLALFFGSLIHIISFKYLLKRKWYKSIVYKPISELKNDAYIEKVYPLLVQKYALINKVSQNTISKGDVFDFGYHYLESQDKITQAKNFQSLYFLFRNIFNLGLITVIFLIVIEILVLFSFFDGNTLKILYTLITSIVITALSAFIAQWYRVKMAERIFGNYNADLICKQHLDKIK